MDAPRPPRELLRLPLADDFRPPLAFDVFFAALLRPPLDEPRPLVDPPRDPARPPLDPPRPALVEDFRPPRALDVFFAALLRPPLDEPRPLLDPPRPLLLEDFRPPLALDVFFAALLRPPLDAPRPPLLDDFRPRLPFDDFLAALFRPPAPLRPPLEEPRPLLDPLPPPPLDEDLRARPELDDFVAPDLLPALEELLRPLRLPLVDGPRPSSELRFPRSSSSMSLSRVPSVLCRESVSLLLMLVSSWSGLSARSMSLGFRCICSLLSEKFDQCAPRYTTGGSECRAKCRCAAIALTNWSMASLASSFS